MLMAKQQEAEARAKAEAKAEAEARAKADSESIVITDDPWYYADPQGNIQVCFFLLRTALTKELLFIFYQVLD